MRSRLRKDEKCSPREHSVHRDGAEAALLGDLISSHALSGALSYDLLDGAHDRPNGRQLRLRSSNNLGDERQSRIRLWLASGLAQVNDPVGRVIEISHAQR
ncbi:hypothetical protein FBY40_2504 [Microbacterium sp. SLBN-154]|nr:hypothetical protein FBY40_2504 [Microbacterium sp. SLBN-154]